MNQFFELGGESTLVRAQEDLSHDSTGMSEETKPESQLGFLSLQIPGSEGQMPLLGKVRKQKNCVFLKGTI